MYPVMLNVAGRRCLVVGGGWVALRKVEGLLDEGADVTVVATEAVAPLAELGKEKKITLEMRAYQPGEAGAYSLAFAATDDRDVNQRVFEDATAAHVWVNVADDPAFCSFHLPARVRRGALQISVASAGEAPFVVRRMRAFLERRFGPEWAAWVESAGRFRSTVRQLGLSRDEMERRYDLFYSATVDTQNIKARVPTSEEIAAWLATETSEGKIGTGSVFSMRKNDPVPIFPQASSLKPQASIFPVSLVGAGPGDAGLLTMRGHRKLMSADAVVYDRLAASALPCDLPATTELHCVGKEAGHHPVPQEEINAHLIRLAREGKRVVRLKGGDPLVFGRGGEEAEALAAAGIPFEFIPGITSGLAAPAYAGIPPTHRREAVRVTLLTAHESKKAEGPQVRWDLLAADPHSTIVCYMGVTALPRVVEQLLAHGMKADTPAAVIQQGTTSAQKVLKSTLSELPGAIERAKINPPSITVIGPVVGHSDVMNWFGNRPLSGERLALVSPGGDLAAALELRGAEVVAVPLPITPAARVVMGALPLTGCVLRSPEGADGFDEERDGPGWDASKVIAWCLSKAAADRARRLGWRNVREADQEGDIESFVAALVKNRS